MADVFSKKKRSEIMSKIRSERTKPELKLKVLIDGRLLRYQPKGIYGKPDFGNKTRKIAIFIDGCFWHLCKKCNRQPKSNKKYWMSKINGNKKRDKKVTTHLKKQGYLVMRFWEHEIKNNPKRVCDKISDTIKNEA